MFKKIKTICTIKHLNILAKELVNKAKIGDVFLLKGELGVGKTTLARFLINEFYRKHSLKIPKSIKSPSFPIMINYPIKNFEIFHYDLYRLKSIKDIIELNIYENIKQNITIIEWPEIIMESIPLNKFYVINLEIIDKNKREVEISQINN